MIEQKIFVQTFKSKNTGIKYAFTQENIDEAIQDSINKWEIEGQEIEKSYPKGTGLIYSVFTKPMK